MIERDELALEGVGVTRGGIQIVSKITATLPGGAITAICGSNGVGKSTLMAAIAGLLPYDGTINFRGRHPAEAEISFLPQSLGLKVQLTVLETVMLGRLDKLGWSLNRLDVEAAEKAMRAVGIIELSTRRVDTLSGGQQQLVLIAQRLIRSPSILLLVEPTSALDLRRQLLVLDILKSYAHDSGAVVVVVMHDLSLASRYCENLLVLQGGRAATVGPPSEVLNEDLIRSVYGVESEILLTSTGTPVIAPISAYRVASADV